MDRVVVMVDPAAGVSALAFSAAWFQDDGARELGTPSVEAAPPGQFLPGVVELVVIPLLVGVAGDALGRLVRRVLDRARQSAPAEPDVAVTAAGGDGGADVLVEVVVEQGVHTVVVRARGGLR